MSANPARPDEGILPTGGGKGSNGTSGADSWPAPVRRIVTSHSHIPAPASASSSGLSSAPSQHQIQSPILPGSDVEQHTSLVPLRPVLSGSAAITPLFSLTSSSLPVRSAAHLSAAEIDASVAAVPGVVLPGGINGQITELKPNVRVGMHRTNSVDFNIIVAGEAWHITPCTDASKEGGVGEKRELVKVGDVVVQRGTMHAWQAGPQGARWVCVVVAALPVELDGQELPEVAF